ncbi:DNA helicase II [Parasulfuritortus cantonensis]|uniref:DNA 3'-5' helicase II n=1 Tax=Parasulfuritortus cantonensis TaxID=2528202 RepID=A0A4R1BH33_9PROT|nr:3'-5' exonuclease [Parasulfuritortus cantonensis]TCJ16513.1 DNA helicase II [Parasulfuritortus cantonensis]
MATLIPSYSSCAGRMTPGERRFAQRLEAKLEDDYLCWYDVAVGAALRHPDFIVLHPKRGLLVLEVKDWKLEHIQSISKTDVALLTGQGLVHKANPMEQARQYAQAVVDTLQKDPQLVFSTGRWQGRLTFPWSYGVVLANVPRKAFEATDLGEVLGAHRVVCQDEMTEAADVETFQKRLWAMFDVGGWGSLSLPQLDRIRWHLFPEIRLPSAQIGLFDETAADAPAPDLVRVMDLQQEQLARSLGEGHRVIHGVAGSGKTLILGYRAEHLAKVCAKPILILCYNKPLAHRLEHWMRAKGVADRVLVQNFHAWCHRQLRAYHVGLPEPGSGLFYDALAQRVIDGVEQGHIPSGQYDAVLVDEGHDFRPEWLKLVVRMVDPRSNSLLLLYDDAQSIYDTGKARDFSFRSVGIQAQGRTTILKVNYRNTREILDFAARFAAKLLTPAEADEDGVPRLVPVSAGRAGRRPMLVELPSLKAEGKYLAERLKAAHDDGVAWQDMAVLYRTWEPVGKVVKEVLRREGIPLTWKDQIKFDGQQDSIRLMPFHSSKGLEFPFVAIPGLGRPGSEEADAEAEARLLYVAMTRATEELLVLREGAGQAG